MKKLVIAFITILALATSCHPYKEETAVHSEEGGPAIYSREFMRKGHRYIQFYEITASYDDFVGYVHDPDCPNPKHESNKKDND